MLNDIINRILLIGALLALSLAAVLIATAILLPIPAKSATWLDDQNAAKTGDMSAAINQGA